jgi:hypothetical protein
MRKVALERGVSCSLKDQEVKNKKQIFGEMLDIIYIDSFKYLTEVSKYKTSYFVVP